MKQGREADQRLYYEASKSEVAVAGDRSVDSMEFRGGGIKRRKNGKLIWLNLI